MFERLTLLWLVSLGLVAYGWDRLPTGLPDPFLLSRPWLDYLFAVAMFSIGSMLPREQVREALRRWPTILGGTAVQYGSMPLLGYVMAVSFDLEPAARIGVIMVGCVPGAMASNVITLLARGNVSYSVSLTTSATLLSPLIVPWTLYLTLGQWIPMPVGKITWDLCWMVVLPVLIGYALSRLWPSWETVARRGGVVVANLAILWIIAVVVAINRGQLAQGAGPRLLAALAVVNVLGYAAGWLGGRAMGLPYPMRRALTIEVGMQNAGLGTVLASRLFADLPAATIPTAIYTFGCVLTATLLARGWAEYDDHCSRSATAGSCAKADKVGK